MKKTILKNFKTLQGTVTIPADKSISHRAVIFSALARGKSIIKNFSTGQDPHSTLGIFKNLGIDIQEQSLNSTLIINSTGKLSKYLAELDCGNSGTTMRLLSGILAGQNFDSELVGDESLSKRPMKRIIEPLTLMGANILSNENKAPLKIKASKLHSINYNSPIASAQVKSCILLAGLFAEGKTTFTGRIFQEIILKYY